MSSRLYSWLYLAIRPGLFEHKIKVCWGIDEAASEDEMRGKVLGFFESKHAKGRWSLKGILVAEVPQELIDKYATPNPDSPKTTWAVVPDEQRGVGPDVPKVSQ